jgi:nucleoside permease NupC
MLHYVGIVQWITKHFAWFFLKTMNISGTKAVFAVVLPFVCQGKSATLVRPYIEFMTKLNIHLVMTSSKPYNYMLCNVTSIRDLNGTDPGFSTLLA